MQGQVSHRQTLGLHRAPRTQRATSASFSLGVLSTVVRPQLQPGTADPTADLNPEKLEKGIPKSPPQLQEDTNAGISVEQLHVRMNE